MWAHESGRYPEYVTSSLHTVASSLPPELLLAVVVIFGVIGLVGVVALALVVFWARAEEFDGFARSRGTDAMVMLSRRNRVHLSVREQNPEARQPAPGGTLRGLMDLRSPDRNACRAMCELLVQSFSADEFRRLITDVDPALVPELPGESCPLATLVSNGVDLLLRHGRVDREFFNRWAELRSARRSQIFIVAEAMGCSSPRPVVAGAAAFSATAAVPPIPIAAPSASQDSDSWSFLALILLLVVVVLLFLALHDSPFRVEYTVAAFLIGVAFVLVLLRHYIAALVALIAGIFVLVWIGSRADRRAAIART